MIQIKLHLLFILLASFAGLSQAGAQGTSFTYQGQLNNDGNPANGLYDFQFSLFDAPNGGSQVGGNVTNLAVGVTNGLFATTIDFGAVFTGNATWLAISVCSNGTGGFVSLAPLQALTPTPYATFANTASNLSGTIASANLSGIYGNVVTFNNGANQFSGSFTGNGGNLTSLNADYLSSGTVATSRLPAALQVLNTNNAVNLTNLQSSAFSYGTNGAVSGATNYTWDFGASTTTLIAAPANVFLNAVSGGPGMGSMVISNQNGIGSVIGIFIPTNAMPLTTNNFALNGTNWQLNLTNEVGQVIYITANKLTSNNSFGDIIYSCTASLLSPAVSNGSSGFPPLLAWYKMTEGSGSIANDSSGNGETGTLVGNPGWVSPNGLAFNGTSQYVDTKNPSTFADNLPNFAVSIWYKTSDCLCSSGSSLSDQQGDITLIGKVARGGIPVGIGWFIGAEDGSLIAQMQGPSIYYGPFISVANDANWHNVVANFTNIGTMGIGMWQDGIAYAPGNTLGEIFTTGTISCPTNNVRMGGNYDGYAGGQGGYFNGSLDDARIYGGNLSTAQIATIYNAGPQ